MHCQKVVVQLILHKSIIATGINLNLKNEISIYPNPAKQSIVISSQSLVNTVEVVDLLGRGCSIPPFQRGQGGLELNLSTLPSGIYFLKIIDAKGFQQVVKFVKE